MTFQADSVPKLAKAFHQAVDDYLEACVKAGKKPEKAYSGQIAMRIDPAVHAQAARAAELAGKSLARWTEDALRAAANALPASEVQLVAATDVPRKAPKSQPAPPAEAQPKLSSPSQVALMKLMGKKARSGCN